MDTILSILNQALREAITPGTAGVAIAVIGLNIHFGFTGLLNMGQAGFMLLGAYGFAISIIELDAPIPLAALIGLGAAFLFALVLGVPTLKLRGDYLAIVTISAAEIVRFVGRLSMFEDFTGGALGLRGSEYNRPFLDLSFLPDQSWTLSPFNYRDAFDGSGAMRGLGGAVCIALIVAAVLLIRRFRREAVTESRSRLLRTGLVVAVIAGAVLAAFFVFPITYQNNVAQGWWVRLVAWTPGAGLRGDRRPARAQPVGPPAARHPRGRGRHPQPGQERLRDQDAGADHRRVVRRPRRHHLRAGPRRCRPTRWVDR